MYKAESFTGLLQTRRR